MDESSVRAGLIVASTKERAAMESGQVTGQVVLALSITALRGKADPVWEKDQKIKISVVTKPIPTDGILVKATFQRMIWNRKDQLARIEIINDGGLLPVPKTPKFRYFMTEPAAGQDP